MISLSHGNEIFLKVVWRAYFNNNRRRSTHQPNIVNLLVLKELSREFLAGERIFLHFVWMVQVFVSSNF